MVCILLALPNITFFLMFSAHKPLQSIYFLGFRSSHDVGWWCTCARMCFCYLSSHWWFILLAPYFFILGFFVVLFASVQSEPLEFFDRSHSPRDQTLSFLMCCSHIIQWFLGFRISDSDVLHCRLILCIEVLFSTSRQLISLSRSFF